MARKYMPSLASSFRSAASRLSILDQSDWNLGLKRIVKETSVYVSQKGNGDEQINDCYTTIWQSLDQNIDAVICLETAQGKLIRVAISVLDSENHAHQLSAQIKKVAFDKILKTIKLDCYWVFVIEGRFPSDGQWVDILYSQADLGNQTNKFELLFL